MKFLKIFALSLSLVWGGAQAENISIATGGTGGVYYPMGGGLAAMLSSKVPGITATAEVTGGSVDNLNLVGSGKPYVGFAMADASKDALTGEGKFKGRKVDLSTLLVLYPNLMHVVTVESTGVKSMKDLKGKRVSTGSPGSATEVMAFRLLAAAGLDKDKDVQRERLGASESVNAMKDRKIDAFFWVGGLPTSAVTDLANSPGMNIFIVNNADEVPAMNKTYGNLYFKAVIPKATYKGMAQDNQASGVANLLVVNTKMSEDEAYKIVKAVFENKIDLVRTHKEYINVTLENQKQASSPVPYHPGALKYFKEKGINVN
jgi:TRAP transporter TAXI family solute receptor